MGNRPVPAIRCIIYDVGGTLLRPAPTVEQIAAFVREAAGHDVAHQRLQAAMPDLRHFLALHDQPFGSLWASAAKLEHAWQSYYATALRAAGVEAAWEELLAAGALLDEWYMHPDRWEVFPDVVPVLDEAHRRGLQQGIISDWGPDLLPLLHQLDLTRRLDFVIASAVTGYAKPSMEIFRHALARAQLPAEQCLYVGDTYLQDVIGARAAGLRPVLIDREGLAPPLDCEVVRTLAGVLPLLDGA